MNKKFYTLVAGLLLAGGLTSSALAQTFDKVTPEELNNQYFTVYVNGNGDASESDGRLDAEAFAGYVSVPELDGSALWTVKKVSGVNGTVGYQLINKLTGKALSVKEGNTTFDTFFNNDDNKLLFSTEKGYANGIAAANASWHYKLQAANGIPATAGELNAYLNNGFSLLICKQVIKNDGSIDTSKAPVEYTDLKGNVFTGVLVAKTADGGVTLYQGTSANAKQIVLTSETWGSVAGGTAEKGYKFAAVSTKEKAALGDKVIAEVFQITKPETKAGEPLEVATFINGQRYELVVSVVENVARLTVAASDNDFAADYTYVNGATTTQNTYVKFGVSNAVNYNDFIGKVWNIYKNGKIASPVPGGEFVSASQVAANYPEGQWLWNDKTEEFVNRESGKTLMIINLRYTDKAGVYTDGTDTYSIVEAGTPGESTVGYLNGYTADQLKQKAFFIGAPINATADTVYLAKAADGVLKLTKDKSEAVEFRLTADANAQIQTEYTALNDKKGQEQKKDIVKFTQYAITEAVSGDTLLYDTKEQRYVLADKSTETLKNKAPFVFKNKTADTYNILFDVTTEEGVANEATFTVDANKLLSAFNVSELVEAKQAYDFVQNDLFVVVDAEAQQYRGDFSNAGALDTIKIFRNDDNSYVFYEKAGFLGMENFLDPQYGEKNPALLADTAFISNTYRPQYLLAVGTEAVTDGWTCPYNPEHNTAEWRKEHGGHCADAVQDRPFISGRYLVNLVDSAKAQKNPLKNQFTYEKYENNKPYYRLGFVPAIHVGDSLIIASTNDTIDLANNPVDKVATFAFKYVDAERDAFTIETLYDYTLDADGDIDSRTRGYIKYHNGVPVVTPKASEAWVFDLETLQNQLPTANEGVNAEAGVSVVAVDGAIIVKNAAGKKVAISNILGKAIANTTIASDYETIAAPAGIAVVAVEGEEAVKVVVK